MLMSTLTTTRPMAAPGRQSSGPIPGDQRIVIRGVDPDLYNRLDAAIGEGQHIHLAYDGRDLELMTTGYLHERYKGLFGLFVVFVTLALEIDREDGGQTTWKSEEADRGLEADQSYYFDPEKLRVVREAVARKSKDPADYPPPDLAIEIDVSSPQVDRPGIYAALRVVEVWRFDGDAAVIEHLQPDGSYAPAQRSRFLPIGPADIRRWLVEEDSSHRLTWERRLNQWAMGLAGHAQQDG
jgi:Uma2 family endonuclease